jgi:uncharacterized tellurite resistance protein B-like protein
MGLLSGFRGNAPAKKPTDDVLLLHAMILMAGADGFFEDSEAETLEAFFAQLPEFQDKDFDEVYGNARKMVAKYPNLKESVKALADLSSPVLKRKAFVIAADIALASGDVDEAEDEMLSAMARVMAIDDGTANKVLEVLSMKYAT